MEGEAGGKRRELPDTRRNVEKQDVVRLRKSGQRLDVIADWQSGLNCRADNNAPPQPLQLFGCVRTVDIMFRT